MDSKIINSGNWQDCPGCGRIMLSIAGAKSAVCRTCGYKEACC